MIENEESNLRDLQNLKFSPASPKGFWTESREQMQARAAQAAAQVLEELGRLQKVQEVDEEEEEGSSGGTSRRDTVESNDTWEGNLGGLMEWDKAAFNFSKAEDVGMMLSDDEDGEEVVNGSRGRAKGVVLGKFT